MIHIAIAGGDGPSGSAEGRIPNPFFSDDPYCHSRRGRAQRIRGRPHSEPFFKKKRAYSGARLASRERPSLIGVSGPNYGATRGLDLTYMSKNKPWLLVFMALGANFKISIFDPPGVRPAYQCVLSTDIRRRSTRSAQV